MCFTATSRLLSDSAGRSGIVDASGGGTTPYSSSPDAPGRTTRASRATARRCWPRARTRSDAERRQVPPHALEPQALLLHQRMVGHVGRGEVRVDADELQVRARQQLRERARQVVVPQAQPVHSGVDLQVILQTRPAPGRRFLQRPAGRRRGDGRRQAVLEDAGDVADAERAEDEDLAANAGAPQHDRLLDVRARQHRGAGVFEGQADGGRAVAVGVGFHDGDDAGRGAPAALDSAARNWRMALKLCAMAERSTSATVDRIMLPQYRTEPPWPTVNPDDTTGSGTACARGGTRA